MQTAACDKDDRAAYCSIIVRKTYFAGELGELVRYNITTTFELLVGLQNFNFWRPMLKRTLESV